MSSSLSPIGRPAALVILLVGFGLAGCGSSSSSSTKPALTKQEFLAKANAICAQGSKKTNAAGQSLGSKPTPAQVKTAVDTKFVPAIQSQIDAIRALGAPQGDQGKVTSMLDTAQSDLDKLKKDPALITGSADTFANFTKVAHPYGLTQCDKGS